MSDRNKQMSFIRIMNFSEDANKAVSKAMYIANEEKCSKLNTVHLFLALVDKTEIGINLLTKLDISFDMLYSSYQTLAANSVYGRRTQHYPIGDSGNAIEDFDNDFLAILAMSAARTMTRSGEITNDMLFDMIIEHGSEYLVKYLDYVGISIEDIYDIRNSEFFIPEDLLDFVEDLNTKLRTTPVYISNVDSYTNEMIEVLSRKLKANPCLIGEAGVGKTSVVYDLVNKIINEDVPEWLKDTHIVYINSALLTAGTRYRGEFEERMKLLIDWASEVNVILFLDELHTFINLGGHSDSGDTAGNMIKKSLSDGAIRIIGATTLSEYHKFIEKDSAFSRRLQDIEIKEPSIEATINMINNTKQTYEEFHSVDVPLELVDKIVKLSNQYIKDRFLPDKAYTILDQACARAKILNKDTLSEDIVIDTIHKITSIDIEKLSNEESKQLLKLEDTISKNLIGQKDAVSTVCKAIRRAKAGVREVNKPLASFLFVGPTGVGKTELCKVLSKEVAIGDAPLIKVDMSEYSEKYSISKMIGSAPGYVGYGEGGQLTEKVKHNPYSILLFDEIEKAHPEVFNIFLQMLDDGCLTDAEGNKVDFTNCIIVMTSNAGYGADGLNKGSLGFNSNVNTSNAREKEKVAMKALEETFKPEFLNRLDNIVIFEKLTREQCVEITKLLLNKLYNRMLEKNIKIRFNKSIVDKIVELGYSDKYGARNLRREIQDTIEDVIADAVLEGTLYENCVASVSWKNNKVSINVKQGEK